MIEQSKRYLQIEPWTVTEKGFHPKRSRVSESIFSLANEFMGVRGTFEEGYGGDTLHGSYFNGVYNDQPIRHELTLKGFPVRTHFMVNSVDWLHTRIRLDGETLDLATAKFTGFTRSLDLKDGVMTRSFTWTTKKGRKLRLRFERFLGMKNAALGCQRIEMEPLNFTGNVEVTLGLDFSTEHESEAQRMWTTKRKGKAAGGTYAILGETISSAQKVLSAFRYASSAKPVRTADLPASEKDIAGVKLTFKLSEGAPLTVEKVVANQVQKDPKVKATTFWDSGLKRAGKLLATTYDAELATSRTYWDAFWKRFDVTIEGDAANEQGTRYCLFQMHATYHGVDPTLNIGAKGLTGEVYGGLAFWDTETYCLPFYMFTDPAAARNLLSYRYNTLPQARERARQLDANGARYPMTTIDGTEACVVWWHGDLEIHVPAAVAYGIWHYVNVTGDTDFLRDQGAEMLVEIARFYASHGDWSPKTGEFGLWGVMGADEFHMMIHNNAYTNTMAKKTFEWALDAAAQLKKHEPKRWATLAKHLKLDDKELASWRKMAKKMRLQRDEKTGLIEQHDGYFDLPHKDLNKLTPADLPICRAKPYISRSRYDWIKQPDVLLLHFFFSHDYPLEEKRVNYEYYEPRCAHESSLSPGVHSILAAELGKKQLAFDYVRYASRLDLDDFNGNTSQGLHMTSMAAAWMSLVYGFGGMRSDGKRLSFQPSIPEQWKSFSFRIVYRGALLEVRVDHKAATFQVLEGTAIKIDVFGKPVSVGKMAVKRELG